MFQNHTCQRLLNAIHPRWGMALGLNWAKHSRLKRADGKEEPYMGEKKEFLVRFAKQYMQGHKDIDYFMFGHRHIELDLMLSKKDPTDDSGRLDMAVHLCRIRWRTHVYGRIRGRRKPTITIMLK